MKTSPLQLDWVTYPKVSFEARDVTDEASEGRLVVQPAIAFEMDGEHLAFLTVQSPDGPHDLQYNFAVEAVAQFRFDLDAALEAYRVPRSRLPRVIAANISRVLFSGVREFLSVITARGPHDALTLPSLIIEPGDVEIASKDSAVAILERLFGVPHEELEKLKAQAMSAAPKTSGAGGSIGGTALPE